MIWLWRSFLIAILLGLGYLILAYRLGGVGPNDFTYPDYTETDFKGMEGLFPPIESWQVQRSQALWEQSRTFYSGDINQTVNDEQLVQAKTLALKALEQDITFGNGFAQLLGIYEKLQDMDTASQLADIASALWPAHPQNRAYLADYWTRRNNLEKLLQEWNILLIRDPNLSKKLFPVLLQIAADPNAQHLLLPFIQQPPPWWERFFAFVAQSPEHGDLLDLLFETRRTSDSALTVRELSIYVERLIKDGFWPEAKLAWTESLVNYQVKLGGNIYDGGFEDSNYNKGGFYWRIVKHKLFTIEPNITQGMKGSKALRINLRNSVEPIKFQHISQFLVLEPKLYELKLAYKIDKLDTAEGLSWRIRCMDAKQTLLGESTPLKDRTAWSTLSIRFTVPEEETCKAQLIRLEAASPYANKQTFNGTLWFDDLSIVPIDANGIPQE